MGPAGAVPSRMRKTFQLRPEGKHPDRVLDAIKHEVRKYIRRERDHALPEGMDYWDFDCRFGASQDVAEVVHLAALTGLMDQVAQAQGSQFYVEILARAAKRRAKPAGDPG